MLYLESFSLPSQERENDYLWATPPMSCYSQEQYPFRTLSRKGLSRIEPEPLTFICGGNGSGKSTLLNVIAEKLGLPRGSRFNETPDFAAYVKLCSVRLSHGRLPEHSRIITSDDVFDRLLDLRSVNAGIDARRDELFREYADAKHGQFRMQSLSDLDELKRRNEAKSRSRSAYTSARLAQNARTHSNGESAFDYFTREIGENALYLLDEPENSLSVSRQTELARFLSDSARFGGCQFIVSTHSPVLLSAPGAKIYDLDAAPAAVRRWTELENVRALCEFFRGHADEFGPETRRNG